MNDDFDLTFHPLLIPSVFYRKFKGVFNLKKNKKGQNVSLTGCRHELFRDFTDSFK